jgi:hypothetical protein
VSLPRTILIKALAEIRKCFLLLFIVAVEQVAESIQGLSDCCRRCGLNVGILSSGMR